MIDRQAKLVTTRLFDLNTCSNTETSIKSPEATIRAYMGFSFDDVPLGRITRIVSDSLHPIFLAPDLLVSGKHEDSSVRHAPLPASTVYGFSPVVKQSIDLHFPPTARLATSCALSILWRQAMLNEAFQLKLRALLDASSTSTLALHRNTLPEVSHK